MQIDRLLLERIRLFLKQNFVLTQLERR